MKNCDMHTIVAKYVAIKFPDCQLDLMEHYVSALILPRANRHHKSLGQDDDCLASDLSDLINHTLYRFNKNRLNELLTH